MGGPYYGDHSTPKIHDDDDDIATTKTTITATTSKMCGSCKEFAPTWESLSEELSSRVKVARCSSDDKAGMNLAQVFHV